MPRNNMHENREISSTPWSDDQGRSANINRTADMHVVEQSGEDSYFRDQGQYPHVLMSSGTQVRCSMFRDVRIRPAGEMGLA